MKGAVWLVLVLFVGLGYRMEQRSYGRVRVSRGYAAGCSLFHHFLCEKYEKSSLKSSSENK